MNARPDPDVCSDVCSDPDVCSFLPSMNSNDVAHSCCLIVAIEGLDGAGKTTIVSALRRALRELSVPTTTRHLEKNYLSSAFKAARQISDPRLKYLLQHAAGLLLREVIRGLDRGSVLICDRYLFSARAYYMAVTQAPDLLPNAMDILPSPDIGVLLRCNPTTRRSRLLSRKIAPSARKLETTNPDLSARIEELLFGSCTWMKLDTELLSLRETTNIICRHILRNYYGRN